MLITISAALLALALALLCVLAWWWRETAPDVIEVSPRVHRGEVELSAGWEAGR